MMSSMVKQGSVPTVLSFPVLCRIKSVAAGSRHSLALSEDGRVFAWGWGLLGQLGLGHNKNIHNPVQIPGFSEPVVSVSAGGMHSACIDELGQCYTWGSAQYGQLGQGEMAVEDSIRNAPGKVTAPDCVDRFVLKRVACGGMHTAAIDDDGAVWCWGRADSGQAGCGQWLFNFFSGLVVPHRVTAVTEPATAVACGGFHTVVVTEAGRVFSFGKEDFGMLGTGNGGDGGKPKIIEAIRDKRVVGVACGGWHTLLWTDEGEMFACGKGEYGRLGLGHEESRTEPTKVDLGEDVRVVAASAGGSHSMILTSAGVVYAVGRTDDGRLGVDGVSGDRLCTPARIDGKFIAPHFENPKVTQVCTGGSHSFVLTSAEDKDAPSVSVLG